VDLVDLAVLVLAGRVALAVPVVTVRVDPANLVVLVKTDLADRVDLMVLAGRVAPVGRADLVVLVVLDRVDLADPDLMGRVVLADPAAQVDRHRPRMSNTVSTTGVARSGVAPGTHRTGSARRITARLLLRRNAASAGTMDLRPAVRRLTGTAHRLLAAGTGRHLPAAGTVGGTGRRATSVWHRPISGRSPTTASLPSRCSTRFSVDGATGSSATGFRCTDLTTPSHGRPLAFTATAMKA
jgi:hypothetical protein